MHKLEARDEFIQLFREKLEADLKSAVQKVYHDELIKEMFPKFYKKVTSCYDNTYPGCPGRSDKSGSLNDALRSKEYTQSLLRYYEKLLSEYNKDLKSEKDNDAGINGMIKNVITCLKSIEKTF